MARQIRDVARLEDPLGHVLATTELDDGLTLHKVSCPLGVVAVIFESRPDVIPASRFARHQDRQRAGAEGRRGSAADKPRSGFHLA